MSKKFLLPKAVADTLINALAYMEEQTTKRIACGFYRPSEGAMVKADIQRARDTVRALQRGDL